MDNQRLSAADAKRALLSESYRIQREYASASPVRHGQYPFSKVANTSAREIIKSWMSQRLPGKSCPDLALRPPSPYQAVFEAKYHVSVSRAAAERVLVECIYQAFFYLALPRLPETKRHAAWDYNHTCALICDASDEGTLANIWDRLPESMESACSREANLHVMILRATEN
jgi:hypothetical protein